MAKQKSPHGKHGYKHKHGRKKRHDQSPAAAAKATQKTGKRKLSPYAQRLLARQAAPAMQKYVDAAEAFQTADKNQDGTITPDEFKEWFSGLSKGQKGAIAQEARATAKRTKKKTSTKTKSHKRKHVEEAVHKHVKSKPSRKSLVKKGILHETHHSLDRSLVAPAKQLQKAFKCDVLSQGIRNRPTKKELHKNNILHEDHHKDKIDASLVPASMNLEKSFKKVLMNQLLDKRPTKKQLVAKNIIHESQGRVASGIIGPTKKLETAIKKDALSQTLRKRASLNTIHNAGIADKYHPHFKGHPDVTDVGPLPPPLPDDDGELDLKQCLDEVQRALKNLRELRGWLGSIPV